MAQHQAKTIEAAIAGILDGTAAGETPCCTIEAVNAEEEDVSVQVLADSINISPYDYGDEPLPRLKASGALDELSMELTLVDWEADTFATIGIEGNETADVALLVDRIFTRLLGCNDADYTPIASIEDLG
jgi:hypothetical protein